MKKIKNGKLVLDGTITQNELQDKVNKAFEIVVEKNVDTFFLKVVISTCNVYSVERQVREYNESCNNPKNHLTEEEYKLLKEII